MAKHIPTGKLERTLKSGAAMARAGGGYLKFLAAKPFLSKQQQEAARSEFARESARILFRRLAELKGTAMKAAQMLGQEMDLLPPEIREELKKSYNRVPPIESGLVRVLIEEALQKPLSQVFSALRAKPFAAASIGQVHYGTLAGGEAVAVKVQYPGIAQTIRGDVAVMRTVLRPLPDFDLVESAIREIEKRLLEEVDYVKEAENIRFFHTTVRAPHVRLPFVAENASAETVLTTGFLSGAPLHEWLDTNPSQAARDEVARRLHDMFLKCLYEYNCVHADPHPGNFLIGPDLEIGLVDFGCVKHFPKSFVEGYRKLPRAVVEDDRESYFKAARELGFLRKGLSRELEDRIYNVAFRVGRWFAPVFQEEPFDFGNASAWIQEGRAFVLEGYRLRKSFELNPNFVYLDRTRYGLIRLFERMGARLSFRNPYEWAD
jgi:predicted unusual protein kinase regulating ubiquinone biosynthesis (AarF/ABC1/UbiB family)